MPLEIFFRKGAEARRRKGLLIWDNPPFMGGKSTALRSLCLFLNISAPLRESSYTFARCFAYVTAAGDLGLHSPMPLRESSYPFGHCYASVTAAGVFPASSEAKRFYQL